MKRRARTEPTPNSAARDMTLLAAASLTVMSGATISPSLPGLEAHFAGVPDADLLARLVLTMPALFIAMFAPIAGFVVDLFGRKSLLLASTGVYALAGASGAVLDSLAAILVGRAVLGIAVAGIMTSTATLIGDYFTGEARHRFIGFQSSFMAFGGVVFLSLGGVAAEIHWRGPFFVYLSALLLVPFMAVHLVEPTRHAAHPAAPQNAKAPDRPWAMVALLYALSVLGMGSYYMIAVQQPFHLRALGLESPIWAGATIAALNLVGAFTALAFPWARRRFSHQAIYAIVYLAMGIGFALIGQARNVAELTIANVAVGFGTGWLFANTSAWLLAFTPPHIRGRVVGGLTMSVFIGQFLSPILVQPLAQKDGVAGAFSQVSVLLLVVAAIFAGVEVLRRLAGRARARPEGGG